MCGGSELTEGSLIITTDTAQDTTTTIKVEDIATTIPEENIPESDNYLDYRDVKIFRASTISDQHVDILTKYIQYTEQLLFVDERIKRENLYPILVVQLDSDVCELFHLFLVWRGVHALKISLV